VFEEVPWYTELAWMWTRRDSEFYWCILEHLHCLSPCWKEQRDEVISLCIWSVANSRPGTSWEQVWRITSVPCCWAFALHMQGLSKLKIVRS
jgi:hypothetical protein